MESGEKKRKERVIPPVALTIAGSDPSGGAGIQVDLKTFAACEVWGQAVITALTAQNSMNVTRSMPVPADMVGEQIEVLMADMCPLAIKTGMLVNTGIISAIAKTVPRTIPLVIDPVVIATSGYHLTPTDAVSLLVKELIPRSTLVTPNIPEAEIITGYSNLSKRDDIREAANTILGMGARAVVIKGGHGRGSESVDMVVTRDKEAYLSALRAPYEVHGSGCCFSAAVTAFLASGYGIYDACNLAKEVVTIGIKRAIKSPLGRYIVNPSRISDKSDPLRALPGTGR